MRSKRVEYTVQSPSSRDVRVVGRYALHGAIASGGMATVHFGRLLGPVGFSRTVAIKRLHAQFATDPEFVSMFLDEARLAARIRHPNVVATLDVVQLNSELFLVMEYVAGESIANLAKMATKARVPIPHRIISSIVAGALHGLHAAHEAKDERGMPLGIVHRDVSPQNIQVGIDGVARVLDFGVAKAAGRVQTTREGQLKGKLSYMAPEQLRGGQVTRTCDVYAAGVMLWELITGQRLFDGDNEGVVITRVIEGKITPPSVVAMKNSPVTLNSKMYQAFARLDALVLRALDRDPAKRFQTAREMAIELEDCVHPATLSQVGEWVEETAATVLAVRNAAVSEIESYGSNPAYEVPNEHYHPQSGSGQSSPSGQPGSSSQMLLERQVSSSAPTSFDPNGMGGTGATPVTGSLQHSTVSSFSRASLRLRNPQRRDWAWLVFGGGVLAILLGVGLNWCLHDDVIPELAGPVVPQPITSASASAIPTFELPDSGMIELGAASSSGAAQGGAAVEVPDAAVVAKPPRKGGGVKGGGVKPPGGGGSDNSGGGHVVVPTQPKLNCNDLERYTKPDGSTGYRKPAGCAP